MFNFRSIFTQNRPVKVLYVSSYIPKKCGIATYTKDLTNAINLLNPLHLAEIIAIDEPADNLLYPWEVTHKISENEQSEYKRMAEQVNTSGTDVVSLQHEFGLYGGTGGSYILDFINNLTLPLVTTVHTVISDPKNEYGVVLKEILEKSTAIVVMMQDGSEKLQRLYGIPEEKIVVIPHGVPDTIFRSSERMKKRKKIENRLVVGNINLLSPNKGIEYALDAIAEIRSVYPEVLYLIIGQTHPKLLRREGEQYRNFLKKKVRDLNIQRNVRFINKYLELDQLTRWLSAFDFYVTPYLDPEQVTSGALAYAVGAGKLCISTPYIYAKEVLADNRGVIVPFKDSHAIAQAVISLWHDKEEKHKLEKNSYTFGRLMTWPNVAQQYLAIFRKFAS
ncbi:MAG TPA: glycosyltransferase family 4 protein [Candidatus Andersenbacteria bacterium]|nr:glycosyltransferase family 4 protein [Candidatus Andersenbacteria bacterium]